MSERPAPRVERIAIGVDDGEPSLTAVAWVAHHLAPDAELLLVHAVDAPVPDELGAPRPRPDERRLAEVEARARTRLEELAATLPSRSVSVRTGTDRPAWVIAEAAESWGADVIVVGPHAGKASAWGKLGSTAERIVRMSPVPVLMVVRPPAGAPRHLLVPVDHVDLTPSVVDWAALLARRTGAVVTLLYVMGDGPPPGGDAPAYDEEDERAWLASLARELPAGADDAFEVAQGTPGEQILVAARRLGVDTIVMGRRGRGRALPAVLGSTVSAVLRGATCPVLVVTDPRDAILDMWQVEGEERETPAA